MIWPPKKQKNSKEAVKCCCKYPLEELCKYVGKEIEIHYTSQDVPRIERGILMFSPNEEFFYLGSGNKPTGYHIIYWNRADASRGIDIVSLITDESGKKIYENGHESFDLRNAVRVNEEKEKEKAVVG